jgi:hypothetical protein
VFTSRIQVTILLYDVCMHACSSAMTELRMTIQMRYGLIYCSVCAIRLHSIFIVRCIYYLIVLSRQDSRC